MWLLLRSLVRSVLLIVVAAAGGCGGPPSGDAGSVEAAATWRGTSAPFPSACVIDNRSCPVAQVIEIHVPSAEERAAGGVICDSCNGDPLCPSCGVIRDSHLFATLDPTLVDRHPALTMKSPDGVAVTFVPPAHAAAFVVPLG